VLSRGVPRSFTLTTDDQSGGGPRGAAPLQSRHDRTGPARHHQVRRCRPGSSTRSGCSACQVRTKRPSAPTMIAVKIPVTVIGCATVCQSIRVAHRKQLVCPIWSNPLPARTLNDAVGLFRERWPRVLAVAVARGALGTFSVANGTLATRPGQARISVPRGAPSGRSPSRGALSRHPGTSELANNIAQ
jgi:hypothetical protein